ncbi:MAG: hypothetical protein ACLGIB_07560 [Actinomycetota bacterium]
MSRRGGFVTELVVAVAIATVVGVAFLLATGELGAAWEALRNDDRADVDVSASAGDGPSPSPTAPSEAATGPRSGIEYMNVNHISDELNQKGVACDETNVHVEDEETQSGTCISSAGAEVTIFVYLKAASAPASFEEYIDLTEGSLLEGPNWYLGSTDTEFLSDAQGILAGDLREL